jgi:nuclear pore complex protein Nup98-Nup96
MPEYKDKSHEELRWEDYQRGDKGEENCLFGIDHFA